MVTVLFADLVDSTGLGQRLDAERTREVLGRFFDVATAELLALRGRPEKFIGDAVMAVFGLPTVSEDDALRAVRAGLAIRARMRRLGETLGLSQPLEVRVGIESGEAVTGLGPAGQLLVTGPVVNVAARLQQAAAPGEVLVGQTTFALTDTAVSYGARRAVPAKGFAVELTAYPAEGLTSRSARRTIPFVGRASELTILRESLARATATGQPVLVTVLGEPGIGKSRLADELVAGVDDVTVLSGRPRSYTDTATFAPVAAIVGDLARVEDGDSPERIRRRLRGLVGGTRQAAHPDRIVERLSLLFGMGERVDESAFVHDVRHGFVALVDALAAERPVLLVFEDAHALQPPMLDLIERLAEPPREGRRPAMVLGLARPELLDQRPSWGSRTANALTLRLDPLSTEESVDLARRAAAGRIGDDQAAGIAARAGGNPYFIIETTGMLLPHGDERNRPRGGPLPPTVQAVVSARLDALPPRLRGLARRASAFFVSFDIEELAVVDPQATPEDVHRLEEAEILVRDDDGHGTPRWRLRHSTLKEVAYASLPKRERVRLHQLIADRLTAGGHATWASGHLELAARAALDLDPNDRTVPDRAADALLKAGDRARRRMENRSAIDRYDRVLALAGSEERWGMREARALAGLGEARYWLGEYPAAAEALGRAVEIGTQTDDRFALSLALRFLGDMAINVEADLDKAERLLGRSLRFAEELGDPWAITRTLLFAGWVPWTRGDLRGSEALWRRALEVADPEDGWARVRALNSLSINRSGGPGSGTPTPEDLQEALRLADEAGALAERTGDPFSIAITSVQRSRALVDLGRLEEALTCLDAAVATFEDLGARWELADAIASRGITQRELGRLDEAETDLRTAIRISEELGELQLASWTWRALAQVSELRGDRGEAEERRRRSREAEERFRPDRPAPAQRPH